MKQSGRSTIKGTVCDNHKTRGRSSSSTQKHSKKHEKYQNIHWTQTVSRLPFLQVMVIKTDFLQKSNPLQRVKKKHHSEKHALSEELKKISHQ